MSEKIIDATFFTAYDSPRDGDADYESMLKSLWDQITILRQQAAQEQMEKDCKVRCGDCADGVPVVAGHKYFPRQLVHDPSRLGVFECKASTIREAWEKEHD